MISQRENYFLLLFVGAAALVVVASLFLPTLETALHPEYATAATSSVVAVTASVTATISCSTNVGSTGFGTLTTSAVASGSSNASSSMSCANSIGGCTLYIKDQGSGSNPGLWNSTSSYLIASASSTLLAGTEGYGINATTTTTGTGGALTIGVQYRLGSDTATTTVGGLLRTNVSLGTANTTTSNREVIVRHRAAISTATVAGTYDDTITYECTE